MTGSSAAAPTVSVVIPTYQRRHALQQPVERLLGDEAMHELVVVVDGSTDGTEEWLADRARDDDRLVVVKRANLGISAARQAGAECATGEVVLFLDDDVVPCPGLVAGHAARHAQAADLVVQGYMPNAWAELPPGRRAIARIYREAYEMTCARYDADPRSVLLGFWAGNFSLRRVDALAVGLATPVFGGLRGQEDREFGIRCHAAGLRGMFDRTLLAEHRYDRTLAAYRADMRRSGDFRRLIHELHPTIVGRALLARSIDANTADLPGQGLPWIVRRQWPRLASPPWFRIVSAGLVAVFDVAVRVRWLWLETLAARGLGSLETQRGVNEFAERA
jgi:glycosyltransferase involved in cell wall biosynthesis